MCYECGALGHIQSECPTYLKKKKSLVAARSDDSSAYEDDECNYVAFTASVQQNSILPARGKDQCITIVPDDKIDDEDDIGTVENIIKQWTRPRRTRRFIPTCHYFGAKPYCYKLQRYWRRNGSRRGAKSTAPNFVCIKKEIGLFASHTARKSNTDGGWYFDSGCSRHMTGSTEFLTNLHKESGGQVTFSYGAKGSVIGKGDLNVKGLPKLKNVLLVDGLKANLISISQLCDQNLYVKFTKDGCLVMDDKHTSILEGTRTCDNCYKLLLSHQCQYTRETTAQLWHKRLGHIHARGLHMLVKYGAVRGLPTLTGNVEIICKGCMEGKQHRTPHSALKIITTKQPLELQHIDLMGPVQIESIAGK
ncbi:hypothetical protein H6P81_007177 [Aristolochia fimbriata]|uniref:CCHC-type domain-containing protein n=1 Tax=Aristolochia fimbriata TaxID=158543 RepID=A0AAV7EZR7_ARIFI|nr:hypothetical protein H6P81_007177 [Aristolochia fimbriata]